MVPDRTCQNERQCVTDKAALSIHVVTGAFVSALRNAIVFSADQKQKVTAACRQLSCHPSCVIHGELFIAMHPHFRLASPLQEQDMQAGTVIFRYNDIRYNDKRVITTEMLGTFLLQPFDMRATTFGITTENCGPVLVL